MNNFKKIALVSAIASVSTAGFAFEPIDDAALGDITGQAGIDITLDNLDVSIDQLTYTDSDGYNSGTAGRFRLGTSGNAGDSTTITSSGAVTIGVDIGQTSNNASKTSVYANLGVSGLSMNLGSINLEASDGSNSSSFGGVGLSNLTLNNTLLEITPGGASGSQGITLTQANLGALSMGVSYTDDSNTLSADVSLSGVNLSGTTVDVVNSGLQIGIGSINTNLDLTNIDLGNGTNIGNVSLSGLQVGGTTVTIAGH